jgi:HopA1 effector protein family
MKYKQAYSEIEEIVHSIKIISNTKFSFLNKEYDLNLAALNNNSHETIPFFKSDLDHFRIRDILYNVYHCRKDPKEYSVTSLSYNSELNNTEDFTGTLSKANTTKGTWEPGWEIIKVECSDRIIVSKNGLSLWVFPKDLYTPDGTIEIGKKVYLRMVREYKRLMPGFYMANSDASFSERKKNDTVVRFYWNIQASYASSLMRYITGELNQENIPFRFKVLNNPRHYPRADAAVLYVNKKYIKTLSEPISTVYLKIKQGLNNPTPFLAKRIASGLSLAEDPNSEESFGQNRCRLLEEALFMIHERNFLSTAECISEIKRHFQMMELNLDRPYLNPHSEDDYDKLLNSLYV